MSHIEHIKSRLGEMFLRDRGNVDETTADLIKSDLRICLERFFIVSAFGVEFASGENGEIALTVRATGRRLRVGSQGEG